MSDGDMEGRLGRCGRWCGADGGWRLCTGGFFVRSILRVSSEVYDRIQRNSSRRICRSPTMGWDVCVRRHGQGKGEENQKTLQTVCLYSGMQGRLRQSWQDSHCCWWRERIFLCVEMGRVNENRAKGLGISRKRVRLTYGERCGQDGMSEQEGNQTNQHKYPLPHSSWIHWFAKAGKAVAWTQQIYENLSCSPFWRFYLVRHTIVSEEGITVKFKQPKMGAALQVSIVKKWFSTRSNRHYRFGNRILKRTVR